MQGIASETVGQPPSGLVTGLDPRSKLAVLMAVLVTVFSSRGAVPLGVISILLLLLLPFTVVSVGMVFRRLYAFWPLFAAAVVMHLWQGEGKTLPGVSFLSQDGLVDGILVAWRLGLALISSFLFCRHTPARDLGTSLHRMLGPFGGHPTVRAIVCHVVLVGVWIPRVQAEIPLLKNQKKAAGGWFAGGPAGLVESFFAMIDRLLMGVDEVVDRSLCYDGMAFGSPSQGGHRMSLVDIALVLGSTVFTLWWIWGLR
jgi:energy-coupling factor transport system permease protein